MRWHIYPLIFIILISACYGVVTEPTAYYTFDNFDARDDMNNYEDGTDIGTPEYIHGPAPFCISGGCVYTADNEAVNFDLNMMMGCTSGTFSAWMYKDNSTDSAYMGAGDGDGNNFIRGGLNSDVQFSYDHYSGGGEIFTATIPGQILKSVPYFLVFRWNSTAASVNVNSTGNYNVDNTVGTIKTVWSQPWRIGFNYGAPAYSRGYFDEVGFWCNYTLSGAEIEEIWNNGAYLSPVPEPTYPTITLDYPTPGSRYSEDPLYINATLDLPSDATCVLFNSSSYAGVWNGNTDVSISYDHGIAAYSRTVFLNLTCWFDSGENITDTELFNVTIDTLKPEISVSSPVNDTAYDKTFSNISISSYCIEDDAMLYFNASLVDSSGSVVFSTQNNSGELTSILNFDVDLSSITPGQYLLNFTCADSHTYTESKIDSFSKDAAKQEITYKTKKDDEIYIKPSSSSFALCDFGSYPMSDREVFWYDYYSCNTVPKDTMFTYEFYLENKDGTLRYLSGSKFPAHFITKDNFITFGLDDPYAHYDVVKDKKGYKISLRTYQSYLTFRHSVGGLNINKEYYVLNVTETRFTSLHHLDFVNIGSFIYDSASYVPILNLSFNMSVPERLIVGSSMMVRKNTVAVASTASMLFELNNLTVSEQKLRSVTNPSDVGSVSTRPFSSETTYNNRLVVYVKEDGVGSVNISNFRIFIYTNKTDSGLINYSIERHTGSFSGNSVLFNISGNYDRYIDIAHSGTGLTQSFMSCRLDSLSYYRRYFDAGDTGSTGSFYIYDDMALLNCTSSGTVSYNITSLSLALTHNSSDEFISYDINHIYGEISPAVISSATKIFNASYHIRNGTHVVVETTISAQPADGSSQTAYFYTNLSGDIQRGHQRYFSSGTDQGTIKFYTHHDVNVSDTVDIRVMASSTGSLNISSGTVVSMETIELDSSVQNSPPSVGFISPSADEYLRGPVYINYTYGDPNDNLLKINISICSSVIGSFTPNGSLLYNISSFSPSSCSIDLLLYENVSDERLSDSKSRDINIYIASLNITIPSNGTMTTNPSISPSGCVDTEGLCSLYIDSTFNISQNVSLGCFSFPSIDLSIDDHEINISCYTPYGYVSSTSHITILPFTYFSTPITLENTLMTIFLMCLNIAMFVFFMWIRRPMLLFIEFFISLICGFLIYGIAPTIAMLHIWLMMFNIILGMVAALISIEHMRN